MVAAASNEATAIEPALGAAIVYVCAHMRWPVGHAYLVDPATGALRPSGRLVPRGRGALRRLPRGQRGAGARPVAAEPRHGHRRVGVGDRHRRGPIDSFRPSREVGQRGRPARGLRLPDPHRHAPRGRARVLHRRAGGADPGLLHVMDQIGVQLGRVVERERARAELERSNADLEAFAYVASHDLAEPLRSVAGFVALLERQYGDRLDDRAREFIAYAVDGVERMQRMIDDLLLYARAGTTDLRLRARRRSASSWPPPCATSSTAVAERGAMVEVGELPALRGDPGQLQRVFLNLLGNAIKYTAPGVAPRVIGQRAQRRRRRRDRGRRQRDRHRPRAGRARLRDVRPPPRPGGAVPGHRPRAGHLAPDRRAPRRAPVGRAQRRRWQRVQRSGCRYRRSRSRRRARLRRSSPALRRRRHGRRRRARVQRLLRLPARAWSPTGRATSTSSSHYLDRVFLHFDLGTSLRARASASSRSRRCCAPSFPADLSLVAGGLVVGAAAGVALGAVAQQRRGTLVARAPRRLRRLRA